MFVVASLGLVTCLVAIGLGFFPPEQIPIHSLWKYELTLVGGMVILCLPPFLFHKKKSAISE